MAKTIEQLIAEIRENNVRKGFRPAEGGPGENTWGDYVALLHSEISEALEAYRDHRLVDATRPAICNDARCDRFHRSNPRPGDVDFGLGTPCPPEHLIMRKPEGVGSELADTVIRLLDMCDVFGIRLDPDLELGDIRPLDIDVAEREPSFGDLVTWLHVKASAMAGNTRWTGAVAILRALITVARKYGIDLDFEVERKIAYNATRPYQHSGRTLADGVMQTPITRNIEKETKDA